MMKRDVGSLNLSELVLVSQMTTARRLPASNSALNCSLLPSASKFSSVPPLAKCQAKTRPTAQVAAPARAGMVARLSSGPTTGTERTRAKAETPIAPAGRMDPIRDAQRGFHRVLGKADAVDVTKLGDQADLDGAAGDNLQQRHGDQAPGGGIHGVAANLVGDRGGQAVVNGVDVVGPRPARRILRLAAMVFPCCWPGLPMFPNETDRM